jgi:hypothetical protein
MGTTLNQGLLVDMLTTQDVYPDNPRQILFMYTVSSWVKRLNWSIGDLNRFKYYNIAIAT